MKMSHFNAGLILAWLLITGGAACYGAAAGLITAGVVLVVLVFLVAERFGVYAETAEMQHGGRE